MMNRMFQTLVAGLLIVSFTALAQQHHPVTLTWKTATSEHNYTINPNATLGDFLAQQVNDPTVYNWAASRLVSDDLTRQVERERTAVLAELNLQKQSALSSGESERAAALNDIRSWLAALPLAGSHFIGVPFYQLRAHKNFNPQMQLSKQRTQLTLVSPKTQNVIKAEVVGAVNSPILVEPGTDLGTALERAQPNPHALDSRVWLIKQNGTVIHMPAAVYNQNQAAVCYRHETALPWIDVEQWQGIDCWPDEAVNEGDIIFVGLKNAVNLNKRISQLLKHRAIFQ